jgi:hypothetical protein
MIQATRETNFIAYIETEGKRIDTTAASTHIRHLVKFINDLDGAIFYCYGRFETIYDRYTKLEFYYNITPNRYAGLVDLIPAGYFKYELYEVSWSPLVISPTVLVGFAPATEDDVLTPPANDKGIVQGLVAVGKLYLAEKSGSEEVSYTEYEAPASTNTIYYGQ